MSTDIISSLQQRRFLTITKTPLNDPDSLLPIEFSGVELISDSFKFNLRVISNDIDIEPRLLLKKQISLSIQGNQDSSKRYFHGLVSYFEAGPIEKNVRYYRIELRPWLWFLNHTIDCRIFQNENTLDIVKHIFTEESVKDYDMTKLHPSLYPIRDYCFQYRESTCQFIQRLLAEEGIFYYFKHDKDKHTLILGDQNNIFLPTNPKEVKFSTNFSKSYHIQQWSRSHHFYSGNATHNEYNFKDPTTSLLAKQTSKASLSVASAHEIYHYPNDHENLANSEQRAQRRFESQELAYQLRQGASNYLQFSAGGCFTLKQPPTDSEAGDYLLNSVIHTATDGTYLNGVTGQQSYQNIFTASPSNINFRAPMYTERPFIASAQTAIVVGPPEEEIYTDEWGRVKVQFHWDRKGKKDETSSCWIRVAQLWAGDGWGAQFIPRIGQEVVVQFLEGNPDRPIITGCVYNANHKPPYPLPFNQTQSGIKTKSSKNGDKETYNELRFEDKAGNEEIFIQAQKDFKQLIKHNLTIYAGKTVTIEATEAITLKVGNTVLSIHKDMVDLNTEKYNIHKD